MVRLIDYEGRSALIIPRKGELADTLRAAWPIDRKRKRRALRVQPVNGSTLLVAYNSGVFSILRRHLVREGIMPPILRHYDWPGVKRPFDSQLVTSAFLTTHPRGYVLNEMGTGKSLASLWAYDWLRREGLAGKAVVLSPLSTLERVWGDEVFFRLPHLTAVVVHGTAEKRRKLLRSEADIYIVNHDGIKVQAVHEELCRMIRSGEVSHLIVDEGAAFRNYSTDRWKALRKLVTDELSIWWLTGTPMPNSPVDIWAQVRMVTPNRITPSKVQWRDHTMIQVSQYRWVPKKDAAQKCYAVMKPAVRFRLEDCVDLPPHVFEHRQVPMSKEQQRVFKAMQDELYAEWQNGKITAANEGVKMGKLLQILSGAVYDDTGNVTPIPAKPRVEALKEIIEQAPHKVLVMVHYVPVLKMLQKELGDKVAVSIYGDISSKERAERIHAFQKTSAYKVMLAQPGTMAHGLTLTAASVMVWYGPITSYEIYEQALARIRRPGQTHPTVVVHMSANDWEKSLYDRLRKKQKMQGALLELIHK